LGRLPCRRIRQEDQPWRRRRIKLTRAGGSGRRIKNICRKIKKNLVRRIKLIIFREIKNKGYDRI
jgi:hypothetical protein